MHNAPITQVSNGGAISLECDFVSFELTKRLGASSSSFTNFDTTRLIYSIEDKTKYVDIFESAVMIEKNTFTANSIGQKGSAIFIR